MLNRISIAAIVTAAAAGAFACGTQGGGAAPTRLPDGGAQATGSNCSDSLAQLLDRNELLGFLDGGVLGVSVAIDLAVDDKSLYYTINTMRAGLPVAGVPQTLAHLVRVPIRGGAPALVASIPGAEEALLLVAGTAVIAVSFPDGTGEIVTVPVAGGATASIVSPTHGRPSGTLATDGNNVYFADGDGVKSVGLTGGAVRTLSDQTGTLAVLGSSLLIADAVGGNIYSVPFQGGPLTTIATNQSGASYPLSCGAGICWTTYGDAATAVSGIATGGIAQLLPGGSPVRLIESAMLYRPHRIAFDGKDFFLTTLGDATTGSLVRVSAAGGELVSLGSQNGLAIDAHCLYSADAESGIHSVALSYAGGTAALQP